MTTITTTTANPWILRLRNCADLTAEDEAHLVELTRNVRSVPAGADLKSQGDDPQVVHVVLDGLACRYKLLPDGRRQIMAFLVPGDPCDLHVFLMAHMDHGIAALAPTMIATISREAIDDVTEQHPRITRAFWFSTMLDEAVLREWLVNVGRRTAYERIAHLLWELFLRHATVGRINGSTFSLPLTQRELADALGLSNVHINRTLQRLRAEQVIETDGPRIVIRQPERLRQISGFDADYLHLGGAERLTIAAGE